MIISATDFQLRVNEYFTKLIQGEEIIIERYGKKFAVLLPFEKYIEDSKNAKEKDSKDTKNGKDVDVLANERGEEFTRPEEISAKAVPVMAVNNQEKNDTLTPSETTKLLKMLLAKIS